MEQFLTANTHSIMALDATLNSHPIVQTVDTPDEITAIFDSVTYNKVKFVILFCRFSMTLIWNYYMCFNLGSCCHKNVGRFCR